MLQSLKHDFRCLLSLPYGRLVASGIMLIPLDSAWFFPLDTVYRPAWIIPFVVIGFFRVFLSFRLLRADLSFIFISFYGLISSAIATLYFSYPNFLGLTKMLIVVFVAIFGIIGINYFLHKLSIKYDTYKAISIIASSIILSSLLPIVIGFLQIPGEILGLHEINQAITSVFSYRYTPGRIHLLSGEPSWAARYILFVIVVSIFVNHKNIGIIRTLLCVLLFFTGSALGYLTGLLLLVFYVLINAKLSLKKIITMFIFMVLMLIGISNYDILFSFSPYAVDKIDRILVLLSNLSLEHVMTVASIDGSVLARIVNPIIAFDLALSYPFGIGGESFKFWVIEKIEDYGYVGSSSDQYILGSGSSPKLLVAKIAVEHGLFLLIFLFALFVRLYKSMPSRNLKFLLLSVPIMTLSDDSYLFYGLILPTCMALMVYKNMPTNAGHKCFYRLKKGLVNV